MEYKQLDIKEKVGRFSKKLDSEHRYASFDYCYNYFKQTKDVTKDMEKSCLTLGFYLASWGMFRGSSFLLGKSVKHFHRTIEYIGTLSKNYWSIDVDMYNNETMEKILEVNRKVKEVLISGKNRDVVLTTKILLGVFGFVPAYDAYFCDSFRVIFNKRCGFRKINKTSLECIKDFYDSNKKVIDALSNKTLTIDFNTGGFTKVKYPKAKIIDMYGFSKSQKI